MSRKSTIRYLLNASNNKKKIVFLDDLGQVLNVLYLDAGETPTPPSFPSNVEVSWSPTIVAATEDAVYHQALLIHHVTNVSFELDEYQAINTSTTILSTVEPSNAADTSVTWSTSDSSIATISNEGVLTYLSTGLVTITCTAQDNYMGTISHSATINVIKPVESVTIQGTSIIEDPTLLQVVITPSDATIQTVTWSSSNPSVMTISSSGLVTPIAFGWASITATSDDPISRASSAFEVYYCAAYVDLGLPSGILWATCNVGASSPEEYGDYFAWGETTGYNSGKTTFNWSTYKYCNGSYSTQTKYCTDSSYGTVDNMTTLDLADDAARANWGGDWRMPTHDEFTELCNNCTTTWTTVNGVYGRLFTSNNNGNTLFLPAAGGREDTTLYNAGSNGRYWSSSLYEGSFSYFAWSLNLTPSNVYPNYNSNRCIGRPIRAVKNP